MEHEEHLALLSKTAAGDQAKFARLYDATGPQLCAFRLKMLRRKERAEDAVQDAYVKIWYSADEYRSGLGTVLTRMVSIALTQASRLGIALVNELIIDLTDKTRFRSLHPKTMLSLPIM